MANKWNFYRRDKTRLRTTIDGQGRRERGRRPSSGPESAMIDKCNLRHRAKVQGVMFPRPFSLPHLPVRPALRNGRHIFRTTFTRSPLRAHQRTALLPRRGCSSIGKRPPGKEGGRGRERVRGDTSRVICHLYGASCGVSFARNELGVGERACDLFTCRLRTRGGGGRESLGSFVKVRAAGGGRRNFSCG